MQPSVDIRPSAGAVLALSFSVVLLLPFVAHARGGDHAGTRHARVNCAHGDGIGRAIERSDELKPLVVVIRGTCTENVRIERDDVTLQGETGAAVVAADATKNVITLDGARRNRIVGLTISGGRAGIAATRGSTLELADCVLENNQRFGLGVSYGSTAIVDNCIIRFNGSAAEPGSGGALAANGAQLVVTNSTVYDNTGYGVLSARSSHVRLGQDFDGGATPGPVSVTGNSRNGVLVQDAASAIIVATTIQGNTFSGISVSSSSSVSVGAGTSGLVAPVTVSGNSGIGINVHQGSRALVQGSVVANNGLDGVRVEASGATVIGSTVSGNGRYGIASENASGLRIGLTDNTQAAGNVIENNVLEGVHAIGSSSVWMFGNLVKGNSTTNGRYGVLASDNSSVRLVGLNSITGNGSIVGGAVGGGVFLRGSTLTLMKGDFNITPNTNDISGNTGNGVLAVESSTVELRDGAAVNNNTGTGLVLVNQSSMRAQGSTITGNGGDDVQLVLGSSARFGPAPISIGTLTCADAESSVAGIPLPFGCTGF